MTGLKIALIGYGKMGKTIHKIAEERGHTIAMIIDIDQKNTISDLNSGIDVAIEFTRPDAAVHNIRQCIDKNIPVVSGTTGWLQDFESIKSRCLSNQSAFFYASNYSLGVNIFFMLNRFLAKIMNQFPDYEIQLEEIHHTQKLDAPSGTAITLADGVLNQINRKEKWVNHLTENPHELSIISHRIDEVPGTHTVKYSSSHDDIEIKHTAHSRYGFARGAVMAAEWLVGKVGCFGMEDMLGFPE
jgi:4-hydroxy-tetrahydrodipicolinate reductase